MGRNRIVDGVLDLDDDAQDGLACNDRHENDCPATIVRRTHTRVQLPKAPACSPSELPLCELRVWTFLAWCRSDRSRAARPFDTINCAAGDDSTNGSTHVPRPGPGPSPRKTRRGAGDGDRIPRGENRVLRALGSARDARCRCALACRRGERPFDAAPLQGRKTLVPGRRSQLQDIPPVHEISVCVHACTRLCYLVWPTHCIFS